MKITRQNEQRHVTPRRIIPCKKYPPKPCCGTPLLRYGDINFRKMKGRVCPKCFTAYVDKKDPEYQKWIGNNVCERKENKISKANESSCVSDKEVQRIQNQIDILNAALDSESFRQIEARLRKIDELCNTLNDNLINVRIGELLGMADNRENMFRNWLNDSIVKTYSVEKHQETGEYFLSTFEFDHKNFRRITFAALESAYQIADNKKNVDNIGFSDCAKTLAKSPKYREMLNYFIENLSDNVDNELSGKVNKPDRGDRSRLVGGSVDEYKELNFEGCSINCLENQLNAIVAEILPFHFFMKRSDVRTVKQAYIKGRYLEGDYRAEDYVLNSIFDVIQTKMTNYALTEQSIVTNKSKEDSECTELERESEIESGLKETHKNLHTIYVFSHKNIRHFGSSNYEMVTALIPCSNNSSPIETTVYYEKSSKKYFMNEVQYTQLMKTYGLPRLRLRMYYGVEGSDGFTGLKERSELSLLGYSVGYSGLSDAARKNLLSKILDNGTLLKADILNHLEWLIKTRKHIDGMELAIKEWDDDRKFVLEYNSSSQRQVWADTIKARD